jgi:hypothetical protein
VDPKLPFVLLKFPVAGMFTFAAALLVLALKVEFGFKLLLLATAKIKLLLMQLYRLGKKMGFWWLVKLPILIDDELLQRGGIFKEPFFTNLLVALIEVSIEYYIN